MNKSRYDECIFQVTRIEDIDVKRVVNTVRSHGFAVLRGLVSPEENRKSVEKIWKNFDPANDMKLDPRRVEHQELKKKNFQRIIVGQSEHYCGGLAKFTRTFYNPLSDDDIYDLHPIFKMMIRVRNTLYQVDQDFTVNGPEEGAYSMARVQHYPRGGGFFAEHKDAYSTEISKMSSMEGYVQVILVMTEKGRDFETGGAFIRHNEEKIDVESLVQPGDLVVYDGQTRHGVDDIDPMAPIDMAERAGRLVGFVTLGRDWAAG